MSQHENDPLAGFGERTRSWFTDVYAEPTRAQALAWPAIAGGEHVLLSAPTGSGKTLAAFLWAIDRLSTAGPLPRSGGVRVLYVSPLKALSYDIERNLRAPLLGTGAQVSVGIRTGDTSQGERAAMARTPPEILITTPESLYLILGSRARAMLRTVETVIVDEIHAVAASKRGSHLALTLERLQQLVGEREVQRIGLSATQRPLQEVGRFLVGSRRSVRILDALDGGARRSPAADAQRGAHTPKGAGKQLDLRIQVPVESMADLHTPADPLEPTAGGGDADWRSMPHGGHTAGSPIGQRGSIWPAIYPELLQLVRAHRSTIVFVNNRRSAERVALRLNELAEGEDATESLERGGTDGEGAALPGGRRGVLVEERAAAAAHPLARAHHGSLSREERTEVEEQLKAGELSCLVATSSLELGIDMGAVDLVVQVESPKSVARGLQRIGRAGHGVGDVSRGRIFPKFRGDLLECTVVCRRMREGEIEPTVVPRNPLDVLAQQVVAIAASAEDDEGAGGLAADGGTEHGLAADGSSRHGLAADGDGGSRHGSVAVDELYELVTDSYPFGDLPRSLLENVLDMLDGRYPSSEFGELRARIVWDRVGGRIRARRGARQLAIANAGTIPDRGLYSVTLPDGRRVGELDEEMVYEARAGQVVLLGASSWRIEEIGRDKVVVTPAPGVSGVVPFWKGDGVGRPMELGRAIGEFSRWAVDQDAAALMRDYDLDPLAASNLVDYLREQQQATQVLPSDRTIVLERFRDEIGDWRLCLLSPYGGRVHAAWGLAISARFKQELGVDPEVLWSDDGIVLRLPDVDYDEDGDYRDGAADASAGCSSGDAGSRSYADLVALDPDEVQEAIVSELGDSALFGARFRENAGRALLIPRAYPGRRTPLWQQRLKAQGLLQVARRYPDFPIVLETYRECLHDVLDLSGLQEVLRGVAAREIALVEVQTQHASPFAGSLLFDYVATYMYEGDTPAAERRAAALALDRDLLRELLGQEELRELIDPGALERVEDELQYRSPLTQATGADNLHDLLRRIGDLSLGELRARVLAELDPEPMLGALEAERRALRIRIAGQERVIAADDSGLYRDALGIPPPGGLPVAFLAEVPDALTRLVERYARTHGPFTTAEVRTRFGVDPSASLRELESSGTLVRGELRPNPSEPSSVEWCDAGVLRLLRRASLAALRKEIEPVDARSLAAFLPSWQGVDRYRRGSERSGGGVERLREVLLALQGLALPAGAWEGDVLPRRTGSYSPSWLDALCASGELVWVGGGNRIPGRPGGSGKVALYFREDAPLLGAPTRSSAFEPPARAEHEVLRDRLRAGACFFADLLVDLDLSAAALTEALWDLVWAGEVTNDAFAPLRAPHRSVVVGGGRTASVGAGHHPSLRRARRRFGSPSLRGARSPAAAVQGRWSLTEPIFAGRLGEEEQGRHGGAVAERGRALAELLLERYGVLTREQVLADGVAGGFAGVYRALSELETLGVCRRGYFVEGLGGAQFALPGAVERLRSMSTRGSSLPAGLRLPAGPSSPAGSSSAGSSLPTGSSSPADGFVPPADAADASRSPTDGSTGGSTTLVLAAVDPAQPYGAVLPWPRRPGSARRPARVAGAYVVLVDFQLVLYLERGGRGLLTFAEGALSEPSRGPASEPGSTSGESRPRSVSGGSESGSRSSRPADADVDARVRLGLCALADAVRDGVVGVVALERIDGAAAIGSSLESTLIELGFRQGPRRLTLRT